MDEHAVQVHNQFMTLVVDLIDGTHDSSVYEDACRQLLGKHIVHGLQDSARHVEAEHMCASSKPSLLHV